MKTSTDLNIKFMTIHDWGTEILDAIKDNTPRIQPKDIIYFDSWASFRGFMTLQKLEILLMISAHEPKSIYELARVLERNLSAVQKDCESLASVGFIKLIKQKTGRKQTKPLLKFKYDKIRVHLSTYPYELSIKAAA